MAGAWADPFDWYSAAQVGRVYDATRLTGSLALGAYGPSGGPGVRFSGAFGDYLARTITWVSGDTFIVEVDFKTSAYPASSQNSIICCLDGAVSDAHSQVTLDVDSAGHFKAVRGDGTTAVILATSAYTIPLNTPIRLSLKVKIHATLGTFDLVVYPLPSGAATTVFALTGQNTSLTGSTAWTGFFISAASDGDTDFSNLVVMDGSGAANNARIGRATVLSRRPRLDGAHRSSTPFSGSTRAPMVADASADDDTTYTAVATLGDIDTFTVDSGGASDTVLFSSVVADLKKTSGSGTLGLAPVAREAGVDTIGAVVVAGSAYTTVVTPAFYQTAPSTTPWSAAGWNAMEWGYRLNETGGARVTQFLAIAVIVPGGSPLPATQNTFANAPELDLVWVRVYDRTTTPHLVAEVALPDRDVYFNGFKDDLLVDVGAVTRALSTRVDGRGQVPSFTFAIFDRDGTWRALANAPATRDFTGMIVEYYGNTDPGRRAETTPRTIFRGVVREHHWRTDLVLEFICEDPISRILASTTDADQLPKRTFSTTDFANCSADKVVSSAEGYVVNGAHAVGATTITVRSGIGQFAAADSVRFGVDPTIYSVSSSSKSGLTWQQLTAPETAETQIVLQSPLTATLADGDAIVQVANHAVTPARGTRVPFCYGLISDYKLIGGVDAGDGQGPMRYVGDKILSDGHTYGEFAWVGHECYAPGGKPFQSLDFFNNSIDLTVEAATGGRVAVPGYSNWTSLGFGSSFVTYGGRDYTVLYLRGVFRDWALASTQAPPNLGGVPFAVNAYGHKDDDGSLMTSGPRIHRHLAKNYILGDYQGGAYLAAPTYPDGTSMVNDASFDTVETQQRLRLPGGSRLDFIVGANGSTISVPDIRAALNLANDCDDGFNNDIKFSVWMAEDDPARAAAGAETLDDVSDILDESDNALAQDVQDLNLFNTFRFGHTPDYFGRDASGWRSTETGFNEVYHTASVSAHGKIYDQPLSLFCIRGKNRSSDVDDYQQGSDWAQNVMAHRLRRTAEAPRIYTVPTGMRGFNSPFELGSNFYIISGKNIGGRTPRLVRIIGITGHAGSTPQGRVVTFLAEDQTRLLSDALSITFALGAVDASNASAVPSLGSSTSAVSSTPTVPPSGTGGITQLTGDGTAGPGTGSQVLTIPTLIGDSGAGGTKGLAPAPGAGDTAAGKFLKADGTYAVPPGTGTGGAAAILTGTEASIPAAATAGRLFLPSDGVWVQRDTGAAWAPWGPVFPFTDPALAAPTAWINQGTATVDTTNGGVYLAQPATANPSMALRKKAAPATPYTITIALLPAPFNLNFVTFALLFRESSSGKLAALEYIFSTNQQVAVEKWTNATTFTATYAGNVRFVAPGVVWLRIADNGTNRISSVSVDGQHWIQVHTVGRTDFLTADEVGYGASAGGSGVAPAFGAQMMLLSWKETS